MGRSPGARNNPEVAIEWRPKKLVYFPTPKCACTTLKSVFYRLNLGSDFVDNGSAEDGIHGLYAGTPRFRLQLLGQYATWRRLIVVRDPVLRFLSAYTSRVQDRSDLGEELIGSCARRLNVPLDPDIHQFIQHFDIYRAISPHVQHHFAPQVYFVGPNLDVYTHIYKIEELEHLHEMLERCLRNEFAMPQLQRSVTSLSVDAISVRELCEISGRFAGDYALLRHYYNPSSVLNSRITRKEWRHSGSATTALKGLLPQGKLVITEGGKMAPNLIVYLEGCAGAVTIETKDVITIQAKTSRECLVSLETVAPAFVRLGESYELAVAGWSASAVTLTCLLRYRFGVTLRYFGTTVINIEPGDNQCCVILDTDGQGLLPGEEPFVLEDLKFIVMFKAKCDLNIRLRKFYLRPTTEWPFLSDQRVSNVK